jgi:hypothetical protein
MSLKIYLKIRCGLLLILTSLSFVLVSSASFAQTEDKTVGSGKAINLTDTFNIKCLTPPEGFVTRPGFNGYLHFNTRSAILVNIVHGRNIVDAEKSLNDEYYKANNVRFISKAKVKTDAGEDALLYKFAFMLEGVECYRYSLFIGDLNSVLWINASYPAEYESVVEMHILKSLRTTKFKVK